jgi:multifunctional methyltransferase subunit TRM112
VDNIKLIQMRLITHNMLKCNIKTVENGYPLKLQATTIEIIESEYNDVLVKRLLEKINIAALQSALLDISHEVEVSNSIEEENLRRLHHALFEIHINEGFLICPESGRRFPIKDGIPNMILHEDEV